MPGPLEQELTAVRVGAKVFTPAGSQHRSLEIFFQSRLEASALKVSVFDLQGRRQAGLDVSGQGPEYRAFWDGKSASGQAAPAGIYIYEIRAGNSAYQGAVVLAR